jgi:hypothetical protein
MDRIVTLVVETMSLDETDTGAENAGKVTARSMNVKEIIERIFRFRWTACFNADEMDVEEDVEIE